MEFRIAERDDLIAIVAMLADDRLARTRETKHGPLPPSYYDAFDAIARDDNQELIVAESDQGEIVATFQLSFLRYLTYRGGLRAQIEAVRVRSDLRGKGVGEQMLRWAIERATQRGAHMVQLTTDKQRSDTQRFYERLGFVATHEGMKLHVGVSVLPPEPG